MTYYSRVITLRRYPLRLGAVLIALPLVLSTCEESSEPPAPTTIDVAPSAAITLTAIGGSQQLTAVVKDQTGTPITGASVAWTTNNAGVVTVSSTGLATAVANGTAQLSVTSGSASTNVAVTVVQTATQVFKVSGDLQTDTVAQTLPQPIVVQARDATGHPVAGATVTFAAATGSGSVGTASVTADGTGQAQTTWTLGQTAGNQSATATVGTSPAQTFTATATAGPPTVVTKQAGDGQTGLSGQVVPVRPAVLVKDVFNNVKPGATVTFAAGVGHGVVTGASQTTNALGIATVGSWTLGNAGEDTLTATVTGTGISGNPAIFTATSQAGDRGGVRGQQPGGVGGLSGQHAAGGARHGRRQQPHPGRRRHLRGRDGRRQPHPGHDHHELQWRGAGGQLDSRGGAGHQHHDRDRHGERDLGQSRHLRGHGGGGAVQHRHPVLRPRPDAPRRPTAMDAAVAKWESIVYRHVGPPVSIMDGGNDCGAGEPAVHPDGEPTC